jgi:hypothetical protein
LKLEKSNKSPKNLVGAKCIFEIFGLKSLKEKRRKRKKWCGQYQHHQQNLAASLFGIYSKPQADEDHRTIVKTTPLPQCHTI